MLFGARRLIVLSFAAVIIALAVGCSEVEPPHGTKVILSFGSKSSVDRQKISNIADFLRKRSDAVLGAQRARVDSVSKGSMVLLLPGKNVSALEAKKLLAGSGLELYHLSNVVTKLHSNRPWRIVIPKKENQSFVFTSGTETIDSRKNQQVVLEKVIGPKAKPIITGNDVLPEASMQDDKNAWFVMIHFSKMGAKKFTDFTKQNKGEFVAVLYDGSLITAPMVGSPVKGNSVWITGFKSKKQAQDAVTRLNAGPIPADLKIKSVERY